MITVAQGQTDTENGTDIGKGRTSSAVPGNGEQTAAPSAVTRMFIAGQVEGKEATSIPARYHMFRGCASVVTTFRLLWAWYQGAQVHLGSLQ